MLKYAIETYVDGELDRVVGMNSERKARKCYLSAVRAAEDGMECASCIKLKVRYPESPFRVRSSRNEWLVLEEWSPKAELEECYVVHSMHTVNGEPKTQYNWTKASEEEAVRCARRCVDRWGDNHPGAIVFKAIKHVRKVPAGRTRIVVDDIG